MKGNEENTTGALADRLALVTRPAERRVAEHLIQLGPRAGALSAVDIAAEVGTSDATVVRTAASLGFASLKELRAALTDDPDEADLGVRLQATIAESSSAHQVFVTAIDGQLNALNDLLRRVSTSDFDSAVEVLVDASCIWWSGTGPSGYLAGYASFLCRRLGRTSGSFTHAGTDHADELLSVRAGDAVVVLAYGRMHPYVKVLLAHAADVGAHVVLVSDRAGRKLSFPVAAHLNAGRGKPDLFATHGPTIVLLEALVLAVAAADPNQSEAAVASLNDLRRSLAGKRVDVDPE
jgi:DNA-binding MurR/RpiR family transcriptional regulator